tara:strand:- start:183 stop:392 length:210 start_codon:yes stop_codon:yes gene_type:complete
MAIPDQYIVTYNGRKIIGVSEFDVHEKLRREIYILQCESQGPNSYDFAADCEQDNEDAMETLEIITTIQ